MKIIFIITFLSSILFSQEALLENLLNDYEDSSSLYKKTKKETAGFLIVYSRKDLEQMQAFTLLDVLKTIRMNSIQPNQMGSISIINAGAGKTSMPPIKLYIDDFEVSTVTQRNAFDMYGTMDIYFVDHIEIYQGGSSIEFGNEPGSMIIRLYSKNAKRENSSSIEVGIDSKSGGNLRVLDAGTFDGYNYLAYASASRLEYDKYTLNNKELSRDAKSYQAHFKFSQDDNFVIELDGITKKTDIFSGFGVAPIDGKTTKAYGYINAIKYFPNNLEFSISATQEIKEVTNSDAIMIPLSPTKSIHMNVYSNTYKTALKKRLIDGKNDLYLGIEFQKKKIKVHGFKGINRTPIQGPNETDIYMIFLEDMYNLNKDHIVTFSAKLDRYENNSKKSNEYSLRLGYAGILNDYFSTKIFATRRYVYPSIFQTSFTPLNYKANPNLNAANIDMISGELEYNQDKMRVVFGFAYKETEGSVAFDKIKKMFINKKDTVYFHRYYLRNEYKFNYNHKVILEVYKAFKDVYASSDSGALIQIFNTFGKVSVYNELIYRNGYTLDYPIKDVHISKGYDYNLAVSYNINKKLTIKAKGENLLDKAITTPMGRNGEIEVPVTERKALLTMEYTF